jgi:hypothetical protein
MAPPEADSLPTPAPMRVAIARHEGSPSGDHLDLFAGPAGTTDPDAPAAACWRLPLSAWRDGALVDGRHEALRLAAHRALYLSLDAPRDLGGTRGCVRPLAAWSATGAVGASRAEFRAAGVLLRLAAMDGDRWQLDVRRDPRTASETDS